MARSSNPPLLSELRCASSPAAQVKALRQLKNEVIGHDSKKQYWIQWGVLRHLIRVLNLKSSANRSYDEEEEDLGKASERLQPDEEEAKLQAIIVIGSLANGGPAFVPPLHTSLAFPALINLLSSVDSTPTIILQTLRTLNNIADSLCLSSPRHPSLSHFLDTLYTLDILRRLSVLVMEQQAFGKDAPQVELIASLLIKTCEREAQRKLLVEASILDVFSAQLRSWITFSFNPPKEVSPFRWEAKLSIEDSNPNDRARLAAVLYAIGIIVQYSSARAKSVFAACDSIFHYIDDQTRVAWSKAISHLPSAQKAKYMPAPNSANMLLPRPSSLPKPHHNAGFPPFDSVRAPDTKFSRSLSTAVELFSGGLERVTHEESTLIPWLIHMSRTSDKYITIAATWLLAIFYQLRLTRSEDLISMYTIPSLLRLVDQKFVLGQSALTASDGGLPATMKDRLKAEAPAIVAMLSAKDETVQKAAIDAGAILSLFFILQQTHDPSIADASSPPWTSQLENTNPDRDDETTQIGPLGISPKVMHFLKVRATCFLALGTLANQKAEYRKSVIDAGVVPYMVRTLLVIHTETGAKTTHMNIDEKLQHEHCRAVVLAACLVAKNLSRSVSTMRTSLTDIGLVEPLLSLLRCDTMSVKVAATGVICNLVMEFSALRAAILDGETFDLLFDHAHTPNPDLRLNSLWAIRNIVLNNTTEVKIKCIKGLGVPWLKHILYSEQEYPYLTRFLDREDGNMTPIRMSTPNAAGEQVDLLNAVDIDSRASSQAPEDDGDEDTMMSESVGSLRSESNLRGKGPSSKKRTTFDLAELQDAFHASDLPNDVVIVKIVLEFLRNLMMGDNALDMIDHVLYEFGADDFFRILTSKLRPKILGAPPPRDGNSKRVEANGGARQVQPNSEILTCVIYLLNHIATGSSKHKQILINQPKLLESLVPLMSHPECEVRVAICWVVHNLAWVDNDADKAACRERARRLYEMNFQEKLRELEHDQELNCRERAKSAMSVFTAALRS